MLVPLKLSLTQCCVFIFYWTVSEHQRMCEERLAPLLSPSETLSEEEAARLGKKDPEQEVGHLCVLLFDACLSLSEF